MSSAVQTISVIQSGYENAIPPKVEQKYEQTSADSELVSGRIGMRGSSDSQVKLWASGNRPTVVFDRKHPWQGVDGSGYEDDRYAKNGKSCKCWIGGLFTYSGYAKTGMTITRGMLLVPETTTGKLLAFGTSGQTGPVVAIALETITTTADTYISVLNLIGTGITGLAAATETVTVTTNVGTLNYYPLVVQSVFSYAGTGGVCSIMTLAANASKTVYVDHANKTVNFWSTDAVTQAVVRYLYLY